MDDHCNLKSSPWLDIKVFFIKVSNYSINESIPQHLTLNQIPPTPNAVLEVNGKRSSIRSECVSSILRRHRIDNEMNEATFVSTNKIRIIGNMRFEVYASGDMLICGVIEQREKSKKWRMKCGSCFLKGNQSVEVYVAGCFCGDPIVLTKSLRTQKTKQMKVILDPIPENEETKEVIYEDKMKSSKYNDFAHVHGSVHSDIGYKSKIYSKAQYLEDEDGELSWFNAGVRVGVGLGLGICLGAAVGVGLLVRTHQATTINFKRRLI